MALHPHSPITPAYPMFSGWPPSFYSGWQTVCPRLLSPDAVPVPYLLTSGRLVRPPSPTPTMSSEDEPVVQPTAVSAQQQQQPSLPPPPVPTASEQPSSASAGQTATTTTSPPSKEASSASTDVAEAPPSDTRNAIFNAQKMTEEPKKMTEEPKPIESPSVFAAPSAPASNGTHNHNSSRPSRWTKARSTSTESFVSSMGIPATLGSQYNQEGFPNYPVSSEDEDGDARIAADDEAIAKQLALTDEAVRQINGTASVVTARNLGNFMTSTPSANQYELPRSMAAYVRPRAGDGRGDLKTAGSFVSSGSSTSSEESEYFGSVQWVNSASQPTNANNNYNYPFYYTNPNPANTGNPKMPPPPTIGNRRVSSPRHNSNGGLPSSSSGPATPNLQLPKGLPNSAAADGALPDASGADDDEDAQTVGGPREGSPSSSSASGLDLLTFAAEHHENQQRNKYSTYIKRKKGAEAVAQWRGTLPSGGTAHSENSPGYDSTPSVEGQQQDSGSAEPPKKRRKSERALETPDASLRINPGSNPSDHESDIESQNSASDSEYHGGGQKRTRRDSNKGKQKMRVRATLPVPPTGPIPSPGKDSPAPKAKPAAKNRRPSGTSDGKSGAIPAGGVQCEYVNPLPPYQRCPDLFTRKYDIPRHMARHARREGELVADGKLPEDKALLWKTIRDKPRIRCKVCLEYFTRQDALKRHQNKQHHH